jgi:uncharacterized protein (TIRG00374 family)
MKRRDETEFSSHATMARTALKALVTAGLLATMLASADVDGITQAAGNVSWPVVASSALILVSLSVLQALRWQLVLRKLKVALRYAVAWRIVLVGFFFSQFLPASIGGDLARVWKLRQAGASTGTSVNSVVLDRITALIAAALIALAGTPLLLRLFPGPEVRVVLAATMALVTACLAMLLLMTRMQRPVAALGKLLRAPLGRLVAQVVDDAGKVLLDAKTLAATVTLSCASHLVVSATVWMIARDIGADVQFSSLAVLIPLVILVSMIPISIAGWGVREGAMVVALGTVGVSQTMALTTSLLFGAVLAASGVPGGFIWLYGRQRQAASA